MRQATASQPPARERRRIRVRGLVQGVGFRPHVYRCAAETGSSGFVSNVPEGVLIEAEGEQLDTFVANLRHRLPPLARIDSLIESPLATLGDRNFRIAESSGIAAAGAAIPADTSICADCLDELFDPADRRYLHPFIACCNCGPRYTMTRSLPYDRSSTTMADFDLCAACESEYTDPADRRFHAEPIACHDCGPRLSDSVAGTAAALTHGEILAIKGIGGYHLACDARNHAAVRRLRASKRRDGKPFAVMVLNTTSAARYIRCDREITAHLQSGARPVVIADSADGIGQLSPDLSPGLGTLGVMLPYTAVHYLLFHALLGQPAGREWLASANDLALVMTSANISGDPLITRRRTAEQQLAGLADRFLHHDRHIAARADDSVVRYAAGQPCVVRRARGFTPHAIKLASDGPRVLALGPHLKSTVTMTRGNRAYVSPHVGDLDTPAAVSFHSETAQAMQDMLQATPELLACDLSADFASTRLAERLSESLGRPLVRVQHHHAHVAAVLAEHRVETAVLGLALDGHGMGTDGQSWGGELLQVEGASCRRLGHLAPLPLPGGDRAAREPWRMAAAALHLMGRNVEISARFAQEEAADNLSRLLAAGAAGSTSAAGRLFDAAAGLLGVSRHAAFEGAVEGTGLTTVALCGGCLLNRHLRAALPSRMETAGLKVLQPRCMPPNDGAISLGQAWVAQRAD
jgi:hydrogenase maturation protein HypF